MTPSITHTFVSAKADPADATLIKPSNWNAVHTLLGFPEASYYNARDYDFVALTNIADFTCPLDALSIGSNTITLLGACPYGVNGTDTGHYIYIENEACLITGGTALSGVVGGTLIVTCAATHSGAFTIESATAGIQEAKNLCSTNTISQVFIPSGGLTIYAPVRVDSPTRFFGAGRLQSIILINSITGGAFDVLCDEGCVFENFSIRCNSQQAAGGYGIKLNGNPTGYGQNYYSIFSGLYFYNVYDGILNVTAYAAEYVNCLFVNFLNTGITFDNSADYLTPVFSGDSDGGHVTGCKFQSVSGTPGAAGIQITSCGGIGIANCAFGNMARAINLTNLYSSGLNIANCDIENTTNAGIVIQGISFNRVTITGCSITQYSIAGLWYGIIIIDSLGGTITGNHIASYQTNQQGININAAAARWTMEGNVFDGFEYGIIGSGSYTVGSGNRFYGCTRNVGGGVNTLITGGLETFASLTTMLAADGSQIYCTDGQVTSGADNTVKAGGTGCLALMVNGVWRGFALQN